MSLRILKQVSSMLGQEQEGFVLIHPQTECSLDIFSPPPPLSLSLSLTYSRGFMRRYHKSFKELLIWEIPEYLRQIFREAGVLEQESSAGI